MVEVIGLDWHSKSSSSHAITTLSAVWWRQFFDRQLAIATRVQSIITQYSTIDIRPHSDYYSSVYIRVPAAHGSIELLNFSWKSGYYRRTIGLPYRKTNNKYPKIALLSKKASFYFYSQNGRASPGLLLASIAASYLSILSMTQGVTGFGTMCDKVWYKEWQLTKSGTRCEKVWNNV